MLASGSVICLMDFILYLRFRWLQWIVLHLSVMSTTRTSELIIHSRREALLTDTVFLPLNCSLMLFERRSTMFMACDSLATQMRCYSLALLQKRLVDVDCLLVGWLAVAFSYLGPC